MFVPSPMLAFALARPILPRFSWEKAVRSYGTCTKPYECVRTVSPIDKSVYLPMRTPLDPGINDECPPRRHHYGRDLHADHMHVRPHVLDSVTRLEYADTPPSIWRRVLMGLALILLTLLLAHDCLAEAPPVPLGFPFQTVPFACTRPYFCADTTLGTFAVTWYCDAKRDATDPRGYVQTGQWWRYGYADATLRTLTSATAATRMAQYYAAHVALVGASADQLTAQWHANFDSTVAIDDPASPDHAAYPLFLACGNNLGYAPSGLRTHAEKPLAYKQSPLVPGWKWTVIGTVPAGVPCNSQNRIDDADGTKAYFQIDRTRVVMRSRFDPMPTTAFAECL